MYCYIKYCVLNRFMEAMGAFCAEARDQCDILQAMAQNMDELYTGLAEYFVFDRQKYTLEEFMGDIKAFKDQFKVCPFIFYTCSIGFAIASLIKPLKSLLGTT